MMYRSEPTVHQRLVVFRHAMSRLYPVKSAPVRLFAQPRGVRSVIVKFHDITMTSITGEQVAFDDYKGKLALVVNVASN